MKGWATCCNTATAHSGEGEQLFLTFIPKNLKLSENCVYIINNRVNCIKRKGRKAFQIRECGVNRFKRKEVYMKVDVSKIDGYAEMSAEEKVQALEALEVEDEDAKAELKRYKDACTKANSEAAESKRQLKALQEKTSEGASDTEKQITELKEQIETLNRQKSISERTASFLKMGMDEEVASKCSEAFTNGDSKAFFDALGSFMTDHDKAFKAELLKSTPRPGGEGGKAPEMTLEKFRKMSMAERSQFAHDFPDEYNKLYGGK